MPECKDWSQEEIQDLSRIAYLAKKQEECQRGRIHSISKYPEGQERRIKSSGDILPHPMPRDFSLTWMHMEKLYHRVIFHRYSQPNHGHYRLFEAEQCHNDDISARVVGVTPHPVQFRNLRRTTLLHKMKSKYRNIRVSNMIHQGMFNPIVHINPAPLSPFVINILYRPYHHCNLLSIYHMISRFDLQSVHIPPVSLD